MNTPRSLFPYFLLILIFASSDSSDLECISAESRPRGEDPDDGNDQWLSV